MKTSKGGLISVMYGDGHVSLLNSQSLKELTAIRKVHTMPVTGVVFKEEEEILITAGLDYKYCVVTNMFRAPVWHKLVNWVFYIGVLLVIVQYLV